MRGTAYRQLVNRTRRVLIIIGGVVLVLVLAGGAAYWYAVSRPGAYVLEAKHVAGEPRVDGNGADPVWRDAAALTVPIERGAPVMLKAVYTNSKVFFLATYEDKSKDAADSVWQYDGRDWKHGPIADELSLFFNVDNSIIGFTEKGFGVMNRGLKPGDKIYATGITAKAPTGRGRQWTGAKQKGDVWEMNVGFTTFYGKAHDMQFAVDPAYLRFPGSGTSSTVSAFIRFDAFSYGVPFVLNPQTALVLDREANVWPSSDRPVYKLKPGLTLEKTLYPTRDQMVEITDYSTFAKGDEVPWVFFVPGKTWGGSFDDIDGKARWSNGSWTVEMGRKLNTGHDDDIVFEPGAAKSYSLGVLVRSDGRTIRPSPPATLQFVP